MTVFFRGPTWAYDFQRDGVRYTRAGFPTADAARDGETVHKATLVDRRLARDYGIRPPRGRVPTVRAFLTATFLPGIRGRVAPATASRRRAVLTRLADGLGPCSLLDVTRDRLEAYRNDRAAALAANSLRAEWAIVRQFFRAAVETGHLRENPARQVGMPRETRGPDRILTAAEETKLLAAFWSATMRDAAAFALWTGLRPGELVALTGSHVDLAGARLVVPQPKVGAPKLIPLMPEAVEILTRQPPLAPDAPVFRGPYRGRWIQANVYRRAFKRAVDQSGIPPIRPHDLRHTVAVRLIRAGADPATVGDILGHKPPYRTTARYLAHTSEPRKRDILSRLRSQPNPQPPTVPSDTPQQ